MAVKSLSRDTSRRKARRWLQVAVAILAMLRVSASAEAQEQLPDCQPILGRVVSIQGSVEVKRRAQSRWLPMKRLNIPVCAGDLIRTGARSRAGVFLAPETLMRIDERTVLAVSAERQETEVELFLQDQVPSDVAQRGCGAAYFITRFPRKFGVKTPYLSAAVEGTEFQVALACDRAELSVFEGRVRAQNPQSQFNSTVVERGQLLVAGAGAPFAIKTLLKPNDAVQWSLFYPPIDDVASAEPLQDCAAEQPAERAACYTQRAETALRSGRVDEAQADITALLDLSPRSGEGMALSAVIALVKNDKDDSLRLASRAVDLSPQSSRAWLALSYARQAHFDLDQALSAAEQAAALAPGSALIRARLAELQLSLGNTNEGERMAQLAVQADASQSRAHAMLGFAHLAQIDVSRARVDFMRAIDLDSTDPLPRLGLGLAIIRQGKLIEGREHIEIAIGLDPANSMIRSYAGKAYFEENTAERDNLAALQFNEAKSLDAKDPTPHFYDAVRKQLNNDPAGAVEEYQQSLKKNDNRGVYRSKLLLDQDSAARSVNLARAYQDLGFNQLTSGIAQNATLLDPTSFSAHRFLSDAYLNQPRADIARVSELLQSQLLQPVSGAAVQPQLGEANLQILPRSGPQTAAFQEFNPLFDRNGPSLYASGVFGNRRTRGDEILASLLHNGTALNVGQFHYQTDGFRENGDFEQDIYTGHLQQDISRDLSAQVELRSSRIRSGDVNQNFDSNFFSTRLRSAIDAQTLRVGGRYAFSPRDTFLVSVLHQSREESQHNTTVDNSLGFPLLAATRASGDSHLLGSEIQYLHRADKWSVVAGGGYYHQKFTNLIDVDVTLEDGTPIDSSSTVDDSAVKHANAYLYSTVNVTPWIALNGGLSIDDFSDSNIIDTTQVNPKLGLVLRPDEQTTLRVAGFRYLKRALAGNATLEPTQVGGFNQLYDDVNGTDSRAYGLWIDRTFAPTFFAGASLVARDLTVPLAPTVGTNDPATRENWREVMTHAYVSWIASNQLAVNVEYAFERQSRDFPAGAASTFPSKIRTELLPVSLVSHFPSGLFAQTRATRVNQSLEFPSLVGTTSESDRFWLFDATLGYRLPRRFGSIRLSALNVFGRTFHFQSTNLNGDPHAPLFWPGRTLLLSVTLTL